MNKSTCILIIFLASSSLTLVSCFQKDEIIAPFKSSGKSFAFDKSIYDTQFFFDLGTNEIVKSNNVSDWTLSFESKPKGWMIRVNSGDLLAIYTSSTSNFTETQFQPGVKDWKYDKSNGDPDTLAIGKWINNSITPLDYTNKIYLLGKFDGIKYLPLKKFQFVLVNDTMYQFQYADINNQNNKIFSLRKDSTINYTYFSLKTESIVSIEPPKNSWDLIFGQYMTTLYTDQGIPTPYFVRGTLQNPYHVETAVDSTLMFDAIGMPQIQSFTYVTDWDAIGYDWKSVIVDEQSNTAKYAVRKNRNYIIRDTEGYFYKLKFTGFFNILGEPGYPAFEFSKL